MHSAAIHMLRRVRAEDRWTGLSGPRLSALSVIVFAGPVTVTGLAAAEQVRTPTISRLIADLEQEGLVKRVVGSEDKRVRVVTATEKGQRVLRQGRDRRVQKLADDLEALSNSDRKILARAAAILKNLPNSGQRE
ncbi:MAG: MarR family transcriptional regulator [Gammaproteobacteria bacterium]